MIRYLVRHWRGELQPWLAWWVNVVALTAALWWVFPTVARVAGVLPADTTASFFGLAGLQLLQLGIVPLWQLVGLWRCGDRLAAAGGRWPVGRALQVSAFLFTLFLSMRGLVFSAETAIGGRLALALGPYSYQVAVVPRGRMITVTGGLGFGVADEVEAQLAINPGVRRIRLESGGGALSEAVRLREVILAHGLDTYTGRECSSACVSAFAGGRFRYLQRGARMGVHLPRNWEPLSANPVARGYQGELRYLRNRGLPDWFIGNWIRTGQQFWYPTEFQLVSSGLVTTLRGRPPAPAGTGPML